MKEDLQRTDAHADDLRPGQMFELRATHLIRHLHCRQLLLGFTDGADFRNGVNPGRDILNQMRRCLAFHQRLGSDAALVVGGGGQAWIANHIADGINMRQGGLIHAVDLQLAAAVGLQTDIFQRQ